MEHWNLTGLISASDTRGRDRTYRVSSLCRVTMLIVHDYPKGVKWKMRGGAKFLKKRRKRITSIFSIRCEGVAEMPDGPAHPLDFQPIWIRLKPGQLERVWTPQPQLSIEDRDLRAAKTQTYVAWFRRSIVSRCTPVAAMAAKRALLFENRIVLHRVFSWGMGA